MREEYSELKEENIIAVPKFYLLSRYSDWGKEYVLGYTKRLF